MALPNLPAWTGSLRSRSIIAGLSRLIRNRPPDLIHAHSFDADLVAARALNGIEVPLIVSVQSFSYLRWAAAKADHYQRYGAPIRRIICVCEGLRKEIVALESFSAMTVTTVYNTPEKRFFEPISRAARMAARRAFGFTDADIIITCVANYHPVKGHDTLAKAFRRLVSQFPQARLLIVGTESAANKGYRIKEGVEKLLSGCSDRVRLESACPDVREALSATDIYVQPSREEALSVALSEALACGLCAVATDAGGNPELVRDGVNGFLVPRHDDGAMAAAISRLVADPDLRAEMSARSREFAREKLSPDQALAAYAGIYSAEVGRP